MFTCYAETRWTCSSVAAILLHRCKSGAINKEGIVFNSSNVPVCELAGFTICMMKRAGTRSMPIQRASKKHGFTKDLYCQQVPISDRKTNSQATLTVHSKLVGGSTQSSGTTHAIFSHLKHSLEECEQYGSS